jgi:hypothetical protein
VVYTVIGVVSLETILFTLLHNLLRLLPISGHDMNNRSVEMHFHVGKERIQKNRYKGIAHAFSFAVDFNYLGEQIDRRPLLVR